VAASHQVKVTNIRKQEELAQKAQELGDISAPTLSYLLRQW
jgi:hypothetical protein